MGVVALANLACAGKSVENGAAPGNAGSSAEGGRDGVAGSTSGGGLGGAAPGGAPTSSEPDYVPDDPTVPPEGDGRLEGGSFDTAQGAGWDTCFTTHPGLMSSESTNVGGNRFMGFDSSLSCDTTCDSSGGDLQVAFFLRGVIPSGRPQHLYFDVTNLAAVAPRGTLHVGVMGFDPLCASTEALASIPLEQLDATPDWQTRCVTFTSRAPFQVFGVYVTGETFKLGLDTFRFGPPCDALP